MMSFEASLPENGLCICFRCKLVSEQMEVRENRRELEQVMDAVIEAVTQDADEHQPVQDASKQKHGQKWQ